jgi:uncharacterized protein
VFGWRFEPWGPPGFFLIFTGDDAHPGIQGALQERSVPAAQGGMNRFECTIAVDDLTAISAATTANGGVVTMEPFTIPTVGTLIQFRDPEGNTANAMRYERAPFGS